VKRNEALALSDSLAEAGFSHFVNVGVHDNLNPRERHGRALQPDDERRRDRQAATSPTSTSCGWRFVQPSFTFDEQSVRP
jgi:hypothetical protein